MISWLEKHNKISWIITSIIAIAIFYISSLSSAPGSSIPGNNLKPNIYHFTAFFFLSFFLSISLVKGKYNKFIPIAIVISILYGISDEIHQFFVPGRVLSLSDIFLNTLGIASASLIYFISIKYRTNRLQHPSHSK
jgi:VanZ family protein